MSPSVRKTLKFIYNAVISSLRTNVKKVTSQNHGKKNVFPPKSKIKFSVLSGGHTQIAVHVHLSFPKYFSTPPLISFWASDRTFYSAVVLYKDRGTQATNRPTQAILTNLSLRVEIPSRLGHHLISWKSIKSNHTSIKLAHSMFPTACDR